MRLLGWATTDPGGTIRAEWGGDAVGRGSDGPCHSRMPGQPPPAASLEPIARMLPDALEPSTDSTSPPDTPGRMLSIASSENFLRLGRRVSWNLEKHLVGPFGEDGRRGKSPLPTEQ